ncbi:sulfite oxidase-like oxidoreductase [Venenivibrio stagnispumantis]|uniref:DMSO/TMAO reductase YedYZ, molybdopterin-dependent catalytic subunit n=1 Tax=Venenivibrio stagnispumantis TaxID=407998 RepID=A0AA45WJ62_9AQUI|nr:sulfite oxidase-like oxidoreductase [Venenivibrio stagnispumantis]MCW4572481.1 sulfite oxidase-like oxidoreductase [Venenivibrio stagnispumantis]SMP02367.1 DMSO/TMAO reductase YedYZ, molybdopterin-dependent catalytic subunit [Venenivibrio stagnispumantis]
MRRIISPINLREDRLPPGQHWTNKLHILGISDPPDIDLSEYRFRIFGEVENPITLTWDDIMELEKVELIADFHCVTRWSCPDVSWIGFHVDEIKKLVKIKETAKSVMVHSLDGYTTNVPIEYFFDEDVIFAYMLNGKPIPADNVYPLRLIVPKLYSWKSAKFVTAIEFKDKDEPGFWEKRGYHILGDPWKEQRYWED